MRYQQKRQPDGYWCAIDTGPDGTSNVPVISDESYIVCSNIEYQLNKGYGDVSECGEVADAILAARGE